MSDEEWALHRFPSANGAQLALASISVLFAADGRPFFYYTLRPYGTILDIKINADEVM